MAVEVSVNYDYWDKVPVYKGYRMAPILKRREIEVLRYVAMGMQLEDVAKIMMLEKCTVEAYMTSIRGKLREAYGMATRAGCVTQAIAEGWLTIRKKDADTSE